MKFAWLIHCAFAGAAGLRRAARAVLTDKARTPKREVFPHAQTSIFLARNARSEGRSAPLFSLYRAKQTSGAEGAPRPQDCFKVENTRGAKGAPRPFLLIYIVTYGRACMHTWPMCACTGIIMLTDIEYMMKHSACHGKTDADVNFPNAKRMLLSEWVASEASSTASRILAPEMPVTKEPLQEPPCID
jgi:hypothetical protein